jgi:hypothetical protein
VALSDTSNGFFKILLLPFEVGSQRFIKGVGRSLTALAERILPIRLGGPVLEVSSS